MHYWKSLFHVSIVFFIGCSVSCSKHNALYNIETTSMLCMPLTDWNVCGSFPYAYDSLITNYMVKNPNEYAEKEVPDTSFIYWYNGFYHPLYNQLDLKEVYQIMPDDTTHVLNEKVTYLYCNIIADTDIDIYVEVKKSMKCYQFLNGDTLHRREIQGLNIYPFHLNKGNNTYLVKAITIGDDLSFEATLYDSISVARLYAEGQSCNIIYPQIDSVSHMAMLSNAHQRVVNVPVTLQFHDVYGTQIGETQTLSPDSFTYPVPKLERNVSYMCSMTMCGTTVRQPVLCGKDDDAYERFIAMRDALPNNHPRADEIDQLLYRLNFLLQHPTRYDGDWWWQFKISPLTYQLEHTFAHLDETYGEDDTEANIQFITYRSELDDSLQRYLLARPNKIEKDKPLPLVVMVRPNIENMHHFFSCPQLARQWAVNLMQALSNRYGFLVMMPEMRTYLCEDLLPLAEDEMKLAIADVQKHYPVDTTRIFLHANCSGGYRALRMATDNPSMFKAIGLYAPIYHRTSPDSWSIEHEPSRSIAKLKDVPMMIYGDPLDKHSPYQGYKDLIDDCHKYDIPLALTLKRNSGQFYNIVLVGEEMFEFFHRVCEEKL